MATPVEPVRLGSFACEFGDRERTPESIEDFARICSAQVGLSLTDMGCGTFWQMTQPIHSYIARCVSATISSSGIPPKDVDGIVLSTMDGNLGHLDRNFARNLLGDLGLVHCVPTFISMQQCASSLAAVNHARLLLSDTSVNHVVVVAFDFVVDDADRIRPFALFGDAVSSCMVSRDDPAGLSLLSYGVDVDFEGLLGSDSFESRRRVAATTLEAALEESGVCLEEVEKHFSTNFYEPIALFNAGILGIDRSRLCVDTLRSRAHCGNCDWMINLMHHREHTRNTQGGKYVAQSFAPGFFACALLESPA